MKVLICSKCEGKGEFIILRTDDGDWYHGTLEYKECPDCNGTGLQLNYCPACGERLIAETALA